MREISAAKAYARGGTIVVTTADQPRANIMTMGFHMMEQHDTPLIGCVIGPWMIVMPRCAKRGNAAFPCRVAFKLTSRARRDSRVIETLVGCRSRYRCRLSASIATDLPIVRLGASNRSPEHRRTRRMSDSCGSPDQLTGIGLRPAEQEEKPETPQLRIAAPC